MFFTGFSLGMGWLPKPPLNQPALLSMAVGAVVVSVPINFWAFTNHVPGLLSIRDWLIPDGIAATTRLHVLRYAHFLCLAYLVLSLVERYPEAVVSPALSPVVIVGRQALPTFISSVAIAWIGGIFLDVVGRNFPSIAAVNLFGFAAIFGIACGVAWLKSAPWSISAEEAAASKSPSPSFRARVVAPVASAPPDLRCRLADA
jgi:hypothetical protein